jgi:hypothetical protein
MNLFLKNGLNIDTVTFNQTGECNPGSIYFTEVDKLQCWLNYMINLKYITRVEIPDDVKVYLEIDKFKADKIIIDTANKVVIKDFHLWNDENFCRSAVQQKGYALEFVRG